MRYLYIFTILSFLFLGCNGVEEYSNTDSSSSSLTQGQTTEGNLQQTKETDSTSEQPINTVCDSLENVEISFQSDLADYYVPLEKETGDHTTAQIQWIKSINSVEEANQFAQLYKLNTNKLTEINYNQFMIKAIYIGERGDCGYKFSVSNICNHNTLTLNVIRASAMSTAMSYPVVFVKIPIQFKDSNIIMENIELSFEEYDAYPYYE